MLAILLLACAPDNTLHHIEDVNEGDDTTIQGRICNPYTETWLEGGTVYTHLFDSDNNLYDTVQSLTDDTGLFVLTGLPTNRDYMIFVQYGAEMIDQFEVHLPEAGGVELDTPACGGGGGGVLVVSGDYDEFDKVLPAVGIPAYDVVNGQTGDELVGFLSDLENLKEYEKIFLDGGHIEEDVFYDTDGNGDSATIAQVRANLLTYVQQGGVLYATDWSYDVIEVIWPKKIEFLGDDLVADEAQRGEDGGVTAHVSDQDMGTAVGADVIVVYDLIEWPVVESVDADTTIHMLGDAKWRDGFDVYTIPASPMLVSFAEGDGKVVFSTFRYTTQAKRDDGLLYVDYIINDL